MAGTITNMVKLNPLTEESIMGNIQSRFQADQIYTDVGTTLVALNPFKVLPLYTPEVLEDYIGNEKSDPHVYKVADRAYHAMLHEWRDQSVIVSGESGAGKTESTKLILEYIMVMSERASKRMSVVQRPGEDPSEAQTLEDKCLYAQTVLETFGNAKTLRNDNSSRFGKWFEIRFDRMGAIRGGCIKTYLLEKSRVVMVDEGERNYHIFYRLIDAAAKRSDLADLDLSGGTKAFFYLNQSSVATIPGENGEVEFERLEEAFDLFYIRNEERMSLFRNIAGILHLGNVKFKSKIIGNADGSEIVDLTPLAKAAKLLNMSVEKLEDALLNRRIGAGRDSVKIPYRPEEAEEARDALAKAVYAGLFRWLCSSINNRLMETADGARCGPETYRTIGILDIFGFESLQKNSFEQLCINYCNERLHNHFNEECFRIEEREYKDEGIVIENIPFTDNSDVIELFERKGAGIFGLMDNEIYTPGGSNIGLLDKLCTQHGDHPCFSRPSVHDDAHSFKIHHYAGDVSYLVKDILDKCRDALHSDIEEAVVTSSDEFLRKVIFMRSETSHEGSTATASRPGKRRQATLGLQFMANLNFLMKCLFATSPHFVKCIKPNEEKRASTFVYDDVLKQLRYTGIFSLCKLRQIGYPTRLLHREFIEQYRILYSQSGDVSVDDFVASLVDNGDLQESLWLLGRSRFLMKSTQADILDAALLDIKSKAATTIQARARMWSGRRRYVATRDVRRMLVEGMRNRNLQTILEGVQGAKKLPDGGAIIPELKKAEEQVASLQEELEALNLLLDAIRARDPSALRQALAYVIELDLDLEEVAAGQALLERLDEELKVVELVKSALLRQDRAALEAALAMPAAEELLKAREGSNYMEINQGRTALQRMLAEDKLTAQYHEAVKASNIQQVDVVLAEMSAFGMPLPATLEEDRAATLARLEKQNEINNGLLLAIEQGDFEALQSLVHHAAQCGLGSPEIIAKAQARMAFSKEQYEAFLDLKNICSVIRIKLKSVVGVETREIKELERVLMHIGEFGNRDSFSQKEKTLISEATVLHKLARKTIEIMVQLRTGIEKRDYATLHDALKAAREFGMRFIMMAQAEKILEELGQEAPYASSMSMTQVLRIAMSPRWQVQNFPRLRSPSEFAGFSLVNKKRLMDSMLVYTKDPIPNSLTRLDAVKTKAAVFCHKALLGFTGAKQTTFPASFGYSFIERASGDLLLTDEVILQTIKHINGNTELRSTQRGWMMMCLCMSCLKPSAEFELHLISFLSSFHKNPQWGNFARYCLERLEEDMDVKESDLARMPRKAVPTVDFINTVLTGNTSSFIPKAPMGRLA